MPARPTGPARSSRPRSRSTRDGSFTFVLKTPPAAVLLRKAAGVEKGSGVPNKDKVGKVTRKQVREIAELKMKDLNAIDIEGAMKQVEGTARSMGITVRGLIKWEGPSGPPTPRRIRWQSQERSTGPHWPKLISNKQYTPQEGVALAKETAYTKFDASVEVHMRTALDPRQADQQVRDVVVLPHGLGKTVRVLVFAAGEGAAAARAAGADLVADDDETLKKIEGGMMDFDVAIATPDMMGKVGRLGRVLGPRGLMPNPEGRHGRARRRTWTAPSGKPRPAAWNSAWTRPPISMW